MRHVGELFKIVMVVAGGKRGVEQRGVGGLQAVRYYRFGRRDERRVDFHEKVVEAKSKNVVCLDDDVPRAREVRASIKEEIFFWRFFATFSHFCFWKD